MLLWEIIIGITDGGKIQQFWGNGEKAWCLVVKGHEERTGREALQRQPKSAPWALCFRVELLCVREPLR